MSKKRYKGNTVYKPKAKAKIRRESDGLPGWNKKNFKSKKGK